MDISRLGEFALIARLTAGLSSVSGVDLGVGDDCAVLDLGSDQLLLATCDSQVEGIHFTLQTSPPTDIGRKALAINLSDIAAMGGRPRYALISLLLPPHLPLDLLDALYAGLRSEAEQYETAIIGGNIATSGPSEQLVVDITLLGLIERGHVLTRAGARAGDLLCVTGTLGDSAAGLYTLQHPALAYASDALSRVRSSHTAPQPRVQAGRLLSQFGPGVVTAMLDISDGLSGDLQHLCARSAVGARVDRHTLPLSPATRSIARVVSVDPLQWALHGGEDYQLLFTIAPDQLEAVIATLHTVAATPVTVIGTILPASEGIRLRSAADSEEPLSVNSWDHLKAGA